VYQALEVAAALDIASNLYLARRRALDTKAMKQHASDYIKSLGINATNSDLRGCGSARGAWPPDRGSR